MNLEQIIPVKLAQLLAIGILASSSVALAGEPQVATNITETTTYLNRVVRQLTLDWPSNRTVNIVCHGHSVPAGYGKTPEVRMLDAYPHLLRVGVSEQFPHAVFNVIVTAIGGEHSERGAARFEADVLALRPDVVTIDYALNDRSIGIKRADKAWRKMIEACVDKNIPVILLTPTGDSTAKLDGPADPLNQHAAQIRKLAAEYHVGLADCLVGFQNHVRAGGKLKELLAQSNHPNRQGHELVAKELLKWFPAPNSK